MQRLFLSADLGRVLLGGLLTVARADDAINAQEMRALRAIASELGLAVTHEEDLLFADDVTAEALAAAITQHADVYRGSGTTPDELRRAFMDAALRLALADHTLVDEELAVLQQFASALGLGPVLGI